MGGRSGQWVASLRRVVNGWHVLVGVVQGLLKL